MVFIYCLLDVLLVKLSNFVMSNSIEINSEYSVSTYIEYFGSVTYSTRLHFSSDAAYRTSTDSNAVPYWGLEQSYNIKKVN